jgi:hypothetical protein
MAENRFTRRVKTIMGGAREAVQKVRSYLRDRDQALLSSGLVFLVIAVWAIVAWRVEYTVLDTAKLSPPDATRLECKVPGAKQQPLTVNSASGIKSTLIVVIGRGGERETRQSTPLALKRGRLCPGSILRTSTGDFISSNGELRQGQATSWAQVDRYGTHVRIFVTVAPRVGSASGAGGYSGIVALNDPRAQGASVPVHVDVLYPFPGIVLPLAFLAAFGGFAWAWLIQDLHLQQHTDPTARKNFLRNLALRVAVLLVAAIPVVDTQVLRNVDWQGTLSQYIAVATLAGAAAVAATPTFRALILPPPDTSAPHRQTSS